MASQSTLKIEPKAELRPSMHLGDCLEVLPTLPDDSVDMVFADLPYGVTRNKWDTPIDLVRLWSDLRRVGKKRCVFVFTATQPFATTLINSWPKGFRYDIIWDKKQEPSGHLNAKKSVLRIHETILTFGVSGSTYNPLKTAGHPPYSSISGRSTTANYGKYGRVVYKNATLRYPTSILSIARNRAERGHHPTQKPVALLEWLIRTYSNDGDVVLDPTMGSGTTGVACANTGRRFIGIEKDATYFATAQRRIVEASR